MKCLTLIFVLSFSAVAFSKAQPKQLIIKEKKASKWGDDLRSRLMKSPTPFSRF